MILSNSGQYLANVVRTGADLHLAPTGGVDVAVEVRAVLARGRAAVDRDCIGERTTRIRVSDDIIWSSLYVHACSKLCFQSSFAQFWLTQIDICSRSSEALVKKSKQRQVKYLSPPAFIVANASLIQTTELTCAANSISTCARARVGSSPARALGGRVAGPVLRAAHARVVGEAARVPKIDHM